MITFVFLVVYALFIYLLMSDIKLSAQSVRCAFLGYNICQKGFVCYDPTLHRTHISKNVIFFENQHFFHVSSFTMPFSFTVVLPSFEQQFSDLHLASSHFQPGIVYTRRSHTQSISVAHPISDPTTLQIQSVAAPPSPLVRRSFRVSVLRIGMDFPLPVLAILFQPLLLHCPNLIFPHATHMLPNMIVGDKLYRKKLPL